MTAQDLSPPPASANTPGWLQKTAGRCNLGLRVMANRVFRLCLTNRRPVFFDVDATYPSLRQLNENIHVIRDELSALLPVMDGVPRYHELDPSQRAISAGEKNWRFLVLHMYRAGSLVPNRERFPRTIALLDRIPNLVGAYFSILEGGKSVPAHRGPYLGYLRYHLALRVPTEDPPSIRVKDQWYTWREGEGLLFDDSWQHEVVNEAREDRVVLIVDVMRPMPWPLALLNRLVVRFGSSKILRRNIWDAMRVLDVAN